DIRDRSVTGVQTCALPIYDSKSLLIRKDGWVEPRSGETTDIYFFGYGHAYEKCLQDFYKLTGSTPLLPRYALGNWWSRFHRYSEDRKSVVEGKSVGVCGVI